MTSDQQDAKTARKLAQLHAEALAVQTDFRIGTAENCLAEAVVDAVSLVGERVANNGLVSEIVRSKSRPLPTKMSVNENDRPTS